MKTFSTARAGMIAGWMTVIAIIVFSIVGPNIIAGQRVSGTLDAAAISAYYSHEALSPFFALGFIIILTFIPFVSALRKLLSVNERSDYLALVGYAFGIFACALYIADNCLQCTLVTVAKSGGDIIPMFRFWDMLYNSGSYIAEAGYAAFFSLAMRDAMKFPRWMPMLGLIVGLLQVVNASALHVGIPDNYTIVGNLVFMAWFIGANIGLGRLAKEVQYSHSEQSS